MMGAEPQDCRIMSMRANAVNCEKPCTQAAQEKQEYFLGKTADASVLAHQAKPNGGGTGRKKSPPRCKSRQMTWPIEFEGSATTEGAE